MYGRTDGLTLKCRKSRGTPLKLKEKFLYVKQSWKKKEKKETKKQEIEKKKDRINKITKHEIEICKDFFVCPPNRKNKDKTFMK